MYTYHLEGSSSRLGLDKNLANRPSRAPGMLIWPWIDTKSILPLKFTFKSRVNVPIQTSSNLAVLEILDFNQKGLTQLLLLDPRAHACMQNQAYSSLGLWWNFEENRSSHRGFMMGSPQHFLDFFAIGDGWSHNQLVEILGLILWYYINQNMNINFPKFQRKWIKTFCLIKENLNFMTSG